MNIVIQPFHDYRKWQIEGFRTRDAHFFQHLGKNEYIKKMVIINRPVSFAERLILRKEKNVNFGKKVYSYENIYIYEIEENTYVIDIICNDFFNVIIEKKKWWDSVYKDPKVFEGINDCLKFLRIEDFVLLIQNPMAVSLMENLHGASLKIFDTIDNWLEHNQLSKYKRVLEKNYEYVDLNADAILSVSKKNFSLYPTNPNKYFIPNAVDRDLFSISIIDKVKKSGENKILGYVGKIQERFDFLLLEKVSNFFPDCTIEIYGPIISGKKEIKRIKQRCANVFFKGNVSYDLLPSVIQSFDVALIPHKVNEFTNSMNPLKLYEYIASGKPVVTTKIEGVTGLSQFILESKNTEEFLENIVTALRISNDKKIDAQTIANSLSKDIDWEIVVKNVVKIFMQRKDTVDEKKN